MPTEIGPQANSRLLIDNVNNKDTSVTATRGTAMSFPGDLKRSLLKFFLTVTADAELFISACRFEDFPVALV